MQCLYCHKRLGLFASRKHPFCSEVHEDWYQDEQSGSLIRRLLEPLEDPPPFPVPESEPVLASAIAPEPQPMPIAGVEPAPASHLAESPEPPRLELIEQLPTPRCPPPCPTEAWNEIGVSRAAVLLRKVDLPKMPVSLGQLA